ncbi:hypothetical protein AB0M50_38865 [Nonomuraea fuscirosea]|uniref:TRAFAC clade GTPase domain-containing protein n=1 Tax=Nonomuraea fuscirosea TaxID=1291556 RepID=UPI0034249FA8
MTASKITVWGAPGSGKTTFLAALNVAMARSELDWALVAKDEKSGTWLTAMTDQLVKREFPQPTTTVEKLQYLLIGPSRTRRKGLFRRTTIAEQTRVDLSLIDMPGGTFGDRSPGSTEALTSSNGLLFLFDPIREVTSGDSFHYFHGVITDLAHQAMASDPSGRLPHRLAVCITKFDDARVLNSAERLGLVTTDPSDLYNRPVVDNARELFAHLCEVSASGNGGMLLSMIDRFFHPQRVRFFATSTVGFHIGSGQTTFDPEDFQNIVPTEHGDRIRGAVQPINVLEPILWLVDEGFSRR